MRISHSNGQGVSTRPLHQLKQLPILWSLWYNEYLCQHLWGPLKVYSLILYTIYNSVFLFGFS